MCCLPTAPPLYWTWLSAPIIFISPFPRILHSTQQSFNKYLLNEYVPNAIDWVKCRQKNVSQDSWICDSVQKAMDRGTEKKIKYSFTFCFVTLSNQLSALSILLHEITESINSSPADSLDCSFKCLPFIKHYSRSHRIKASDIPKTIF